VKWSVTRDENIVWRTPLPNGGQSGIAVWGDRLFLTTFDTLKAGEKMSGSILGLCVDAKTGKILWSVKLKGPTLSPVLYAYSDSTSPTPVTDGRHVWFTNNSGEMGCWDFEGKEVWRRSYEPWGAPYPFNKQHEPMLVGDTIINVEPLDGNPKDKSGWNYLRGIDARTGKTRWIAEDGTTTYCTSVFGYTAQGLPAILTGRGGHHGVPETPVGLSLVSLAPGNEGKTIWRFIADTDADGKPFKKPGTPDVLAWQALYTMHWDKEHAYWFRLNPEEAHLVFDSRTGKLEREQSLIRDVNYRQWDPVAKKHIVHTNVNLRDMRELSPRSPLADGEVMRVQPAWHANIVINGYHYFLTSTAHRRNRHAPKGRAGPSHCIARVNISTGKVEYFEVPVTVLRKPGAPDDPVYGVAQRTTTLNNEGLDIAAEDRSRTDGWEIPAFWGSPVAINDKIYVTTMIGITYVIDSKAPVLDKHALLAVNDLGPNGETWSLNSISYDAGRIYHRSLNELVCIGKKIGTTKP
jgi:outer membrane protein assembly factor BamB